KGYGWSRMWVRWCTSLLKQEPARKYLRNKGEYIEYIGIAFDEPKRHENIPKNVVHPLFDWGITEAEALQYCYDRGFDWGGLYEDFSRVSCWLCPLQPLKELRTLYRKYPDLWLKLKEMDSKANYKFRPDYSVQELEDKFIKEEMESKMK
ncbi:MAG: 3'-phosphoadenosine 5'-phosphosulfate sulfotransferase (PAPS reductase)/FAD synthetase, partial [Tyzzerella sp.]|nr:3'-phosphoadenosine 5'-phosphosulfate sulfotransferase (PAPS reductase)/FAD synthetase [Tyzzerella sp.]